MGALQAKENIWYVGVQDPGLRVFDIIMHSDHGTSYNSYIVKGTEKTVLFETSKEPFFEEFLANIREVCDPASLDYIVVNHTEPDHTGSMKRLLELAPGGKSPVLPPLESEEFGFVLRGQVTLVAGKRSYTVKKGDSFCLRPSAAHYLENVSARPAAVLWVSTPPSF